MNVQVTSICRSEVRVREGIGSDGQRVIDVEIGRNLATSERDSGMRLSDFCEKVGVGYEAFRRMRYKATMPWFDKMRPREAGRREELFHEWQVEALRAMLELADLGVSHRVAALAIRQGKGADLKAMLISLSQSEALLQKGDDDVQE